MTLRSRRFFYCFYDILLYQGAGHSQIHVCRKAMSSKPKRKALKKVTFCSNWLLELMVGIRFLWIVGSNEKPNIASCEQKSLISLRAKEAGLIKRVISYKSKPLYVATNSKVEFLKDNKTIDQQVIRTVKNNSAKRNSIGVFKRKSIPIGHSPEAPTMGKVTIRKYAVSIYAG